VSPQPAIVTSSPAGGSNSESGGGRTIGATLDWIGLDFGHQRSGQQLHLCIHCVICKKEIAINFFDYLNYTN
jgi:hypothetical protein